jgi:hypothetical protein
MRIVQTFWTGNQDPLRRSCGWQAPEYNLMSWVMSAHSLREYYDEVVLYTDTAGRHLLIDTLRLPYTEVCTVLDDFPCLPQHWALSKIKTYSMQSSPFIHVDGDVFITEPLPKRVENAPLVAQNREIGTIYYRRMMDRILEHRDIRLPEYIDKGLREESIASYNMGFLGATDLDFIRRYCQEVFRFMEENRMNDASCPHSRVDCNVFFEQVIFAVMADREGREVTGVLDHAVKDEGYTRADFCDLDHYGQKPFYHILGGHKRNQSVCEMMDRAMLRMFPEEYRQILHLCPTRHRRLNRNVIYVEGMMTARQSLAQYEDFLTEREKEWSELDVEELFRMEQDIAAHVRFTEADGEAQREFTLKACPWISLFDIPKEWHPWAVIQLKEKFKCEQTYPLTMIAVMPCLKERGLRDAPLLDMGRRILGKLQERSMTFGELQDSIVGSFRLENEGARSGARLHVLHEVKGLLKHGIISINRMD